MARYWDIGQVCDFGNISVPHHFKATTKPVNTLMPKPRVDIMAAKPQGIKASTFYEIAKVTSAEAVGFASSLSGQERIYDSKQLKVKN